MESNATVEHLQERIDLLTDKLNSSGASDDGNTVAAQHAALEQRRAREDAAKRKRRDAELAEPEM